MKKALLVILGLFLMNSYGLAQVLADFEADANGFSDNGWAKGFTSVGQAADLTGRSTGVLKLSFDGSKDGKGDIEKDEVDAKGQIMTYWVYLPTGTPDSVTIKLWGQDKGTWTWTEAAYQSRDIPKGVWYPLNFYMEQYRLDPNMKFDAKNNKIGKMGVEVAIWDEKDADRNWKGDILIDDVSFVGAEPTVLADFEKDLNGYKSLWGDASLTFTQVKDPLNTAQGVVEASYSTKGAAFGSDNAVDASKAHVLTFWVWLPKEVPDSALFKVFAQDNKDWSWNENDYLGKAIPKEVWYPLYFDMEAVRAKPGSKFDHHVNKLGKFGFEISSVNWTGKFYIDNFSLGGIEVGDKWVVADFESTVNPTQGFTAPGWGGATGTLSQRTVDGNGVLVVPCDFNISVDATSKCVIQKDNLSFYDNKTNTPAKDYSMDVFIPADFPLGVQVGVVLNGPITNSTWSEALYTVADTGTGNVVKRGKWNTIRHDLTTDANVADIKATGQMYVQVYNNVANFKGELLYDNLTIHGIKKPIGALTSPLTTAKVDTAKLVGNPFEYVRIEWVDNDLGTETYNVYRSEKPITDLKSADVVQIASDIPHGAKGWGHRPYTSDGAVKNYYFAVTAFDGTEETVILDQAKVGPITVATSPTLKISYVQDFASKFQLDGLDDEFVPYKSSKILPEGVGAAIAGTPEWTKDSKDINFAITMVIDQKYLYISADVTDDDVRTETTEQAWQGDALEFYMGFYNAATLQQLHKKNSVSSHKDGDWRIGFLSTGETALDGGAALAVPGCESTVYQKLTNDGYIVEARIALDSLAKDHKFTLTNGMMMPLKIDNNDWDPSKDNTQRRQIAQWGATGWDADQSWLRANAWGYMEVTGLTGVADEKNLLPKEYNLYNNYPNPFNPSTVIKYDLPKDSKVTLKVYDILGKEIMTLVDGDMKAGRYEVKLNGINLTSGMYIYRITAGNYTLSKKMMLVK